MKKIFFLTVIVSLSLNVLCGTTSTHNRPEKEIRIIKETREILKERIINPQSRATPPRMIKIWLSLENGVIKMSRGRSCDIKGELYLWDMRRLRYGGVVVYIWNDYHNCYYYFVVPKDRKKEFIVEAYLVK